VSSPNYPGKYYTDADCRWTLTVQPTQTVRLTLLDFELDVRRGGQCHDFLRIAYRRRLYRVQSTADRGGGDSTLLFPVRPPTSMSMSSGLRISNYLVTSSSTAATVTVGTATTASPSAEVDVFSECGSLGKQVIDVASDSVDVWFKTGQSGLTQRGFIMYFEGEEADLQKCHFNQLARIVVLSVFYHVLVLNGGHTKCVATQNSRHIILFLFDFHPLGIFCYKNLRLCLKRFVCWATRIMSLCLLSSETSGILINKRRHFSSNWWNLCDERCMHGQRHMQVLS
jgi:hypothetical protein